MAINRRVTTQDISWFLDLHRNNQLFLNPTYQRRSVWSPKDRRFFLDTIFRGYPSPSIFLNKEITKDSKTTYAVVDGKQRLETIIRFTMDKIALDKEYGDSRLDGKKWKDIQSDPDLTRMFWDYVIPVEFINVEGGTTWVKEVFDRLNRNSRKLTRQELRHAKYDGWFINFVEVESSEPDWRDLGVVTTAKARRMSDVQCLSELLIVLLKNDFSGFDQEEIDTFCADYDDPFEYDAEFNEDEIKKKFVEGRRFLIDLEKHASIITRYAKDFKNLYTLWTIIILNYDNLPPLNDLATTYLTFMKEVHKFKEQENLENLSEEGQTQSFTYYKNSIGASTEGPQRKARYTSLKQVIFGKNSK